ncbi:hypothetical protein [Actinokineospora pegani]|uniref:hypothetical protein n=1 Tax=Actinokineospora pegani TaxID=2654637 RepID=UPI0012EA6231|nr:hypothetical protein [Actinokineospora pegani]
MTAILPAPGSLGSALDLVDLLDTCDTCTGTGLVAVPRGVEGCTVCLGAGLARVCGDCLGPGHTCGGLPCDTCDGAGQVA